MEQGGQLMGGSCQVGRWEGWKIRQKNLWQRRIATLFLGKHTQWFYYKFLREDGPLVGRGDTFSSHWYWLSEAFWSHICGSHDLALEYLIRTFFTKYRSKKWQGPKL